MPAHGINVTNEHQHVFKENFIKTIAAGSAGMFASNFLIEAMQVNKLDIIGYISGILGLDLEEKNWKSIFEQTIDFGYSEIEISNYLTRIIHE